MKCKDKNTVDYEATDGWGRDIDPETYWRNTGLSQAAIERIKAYKREQGNKSKLYAEKEKNARLVKR